MRTIKSEGGVGDQCKLENSSSLFGCGENIVLNYNITGVKVPRFTVVCSVAAHRDDHWQNS